jgi:hypothetical protein
MFLNIWCPSVGCIPNLQGATTMKKFLAIYIGTAAALERSKWSELSVEERQEREHAGWNAWGEWAALNAASIVDHGGPLGKTKRVAPEGVSDIKNAMAAYAFVEAESHEAAAKLFATHPHFSVFPGDSVEIMECTPLPTR